MKIISNITNKTFKWSVFDRHNLMNEETFVFLKLIVLFELDY
jgi:hypothetical protein